MAAPLRSSTLPAALAALFAASVLATAAPAATTSAVSATGGERRVAQPRVNPDAKLMAEFESHVKAYSELHRKLEATLTDLPKEATAQQIDTHQNALAQQIGRARVNTKVGNIFTKDIRSLFRRSLARVFAGKDGLTIKALIMDENPGKIRLSVNSRYPDAIPVTTMPEQVLQALPKLPEELEYRFIGDRLILFDVHAQIIVDLLDNAVPR